MCFIECIALCLFFLYMFDERCILLIDIRQLYRANTDHSNLYDILEKYVGITGDALQFIKSYFSDRSQSTRIGSIMSDIVHIICGVPQGSVLGPFKFCI